MRPLRDMQTIQIDITNACVNSCSNCTRFCGHHPQPFFMSFDDFRSAVDSLADFPNMVGVMGGEPLLHPEFEEFCGYLHSRVPPQRCGLWSTFPPSGQRHARLIAETFWNVLLNDHSAGGIPHMPLLIGARECLPEAEAWYAIDHCFYQNGWSAAITPKGAYFCEVAAALDMILGLNRGWPVASGWWRKSPYHFQDQMEAFCLDCGGALNCQARIDIEGIDDVSPAWLEKLKQHGSPKVKAGRCRIYQGQMFSNQQKINDFRHRDQGYFHRIAGKYGLTLVQQPSGFLRPVLQSPSVQ